MIGKGLAMKWKLRRSVLATVLCLPFVGAASADTVTVTVTGTTTYDPSGLFGSVGADITVVYKFDTALGTSSHDALYTEVSVSGPERSTVSCRLPSALR